MKALVVSDTHLGSAFDPKQLDFLYSLFSLYDHIILNGDFWCYYSFDFKTFLDSKWNVLFPLLKKKETIYIYGNHDREVWCLGGANNFSNFQTLKYTFSLGGKNFIIQHGDAQLSRLCFNNDIAVKVSRMVKPVGPFITEKLYLNSCIFTKKIQKFLNKQLKKSPCDQMQLQGETYNIFGHTHYSEVDKDLKFINTGYINKKRGQYLEINDDDFQLNSVDYR